MGCFALLALVGAATPAYAHPEYAPQRSNRYLKLSLTGGGAVRIAYTVMIGEAPATAARQIADTNRDGTVDDAEQRAAAAQLTATVERGLAITLDGRPARARWEVPAIGGFEDPRVGPIPYSIDLIGRLVTGGGEHTVSIDDATPLDALGDTEVRIEEGPQAKLLAAWQARDDGKVQARFLFRGPKRSGIEDRSIGFRFVDHSTAKPARRLPFALVGSGVAVAVAAYLVLRGRRRPGRARDASGG